MGKPVPSVPAPRAASAAGLRVCVVGSGWHFYSGISLYTCRLTNTLAERHQASAILMRRLLPRRLYPGAARVGERLTTAQYRPDVDVFDGVDYWAVPSLAGAARFLRRQRPDVLVMQWWTGAVLHSYLPIAAAARLLGARVVLELHELQDTGEARHGLARRYTEALLPRLLRLTDALVVHSAFDADQVSRLPGFRDLPVTVVPHGPYDHLLTSSDGQGDDGGQHAAQPSPPPEAALLQDGEYRYLFFGTVRPYKGLEHLVEAFNRLTSDEVADRRLVIVGETWEGWDLPARLVASSPHRDRITFVNRYVHDTEAAWFLEHCDAVVLPYLRSSASGPLHLAMSHGLPVVVSAVGGLTEAAQGYEGVTFVPPGDIDALQAALRSLPARPQERYPDPHDWDRTAALFSSTFDAVTAGGPTVPGQAGSGQAGSGQAGSGQAGPGRAGSAGARVDRARRRIRAARTVGGFAARTVRNLAARSGAATSGTGPQDLGTPGTRGTAAPLAPTPISGVPLPTRTRHESAVSPTLERLGIRVPGRRRDLPADGPTVSVVIPTLNEARNLSWVAERMPAGVHEIVLVDGRSVDGTVETARRLWPDVRVVHQTRRGKGNALACGFAAVTGEITVMIDADGSMDPGEIPYFVDALVGGADYVKGSRFAHGGGSCDITRLRQLGNRFFNVVTNAGYGARFTDLCYGYNAFWTRIQPAFGLDAGTPDEAPGERRWGDGFEIETMLNIRAHRAGCQVGEVPSFEGQRLHGSSNLNTFRDGLRVLRTIVSEYSQAPARLPADGQGTTAGRPAGSGAHGRMLRIDLTADDADWRRRQEASA